MGAPASGAPFAFPRVEPALLSAAPDVDSASNGNPEQPTKLKVKGGGQECPPYTIFRREIQSAIGHVREAVDGAGRKPLGAWRRAPAV